MLTNENSNQKKATEAKTRVIEMAAHKTLEH